MDTKLKTQITHLLDEAHEAADPSTGGLLGRADLEDLVMRLASVIEQLTRANDDIAAEHQMLLARMRRIPFIEGIPEAFTLHG